jgi:hypothetical protein
MANRRSKDFKDAMENVCFFVTVSRLHADGSPTTIKAELTAEGSPGMTHNPFDVTLAHGLALRDLEAQAVVTLTGTKGHNVTYSGSLVIDRVQAERMVRTFKIIDDGTGKLEDKYGVPATFGQYMARLADVLGVKRFLFPSSAGGPGGASVSTREAISRIDLLAQQLGQEQRGGTTHTTHSA